MIGQSEIDDIIAFSQQVKRIIEAVADFNTVDAIEFAKLMQIGRQTVALDSIAHDLAILRSLFVSAMEGDGWIRTASVN